MMAHIMFLTVTLFVSYVYIRAEWAYLIEQKHDYQLPVHKVMLKFWVWDKDKL